MKKLILALIATQFLVVCTFSQTKKLELPAKLEGIPERIIEHEGFIVSFNRQTNCPNWVAWELTAEETNGSIQRSNNFLPDPDVPLNHRVTTYDYKNSGYDRGHMCPAADMKWSIEAMRECFYMSNICPQNHTLNAGAWEKLEAACRRWAQQEGKIYIVCGPIYKDGRKKITIGAEHQVRVPDAFFKVILSVRKNNEKAIGFYYYNDDSKQIMSEMCGSVDDIEEITGYNFFVNLDKDLEERVESTYKLSKWK